MDIFQILFYQPTFNLMVWLMDKFGSIGIAIIIIAIISKIIIIPLTRKQLDSAKSSSKLQSQMNEIRKKYKNNEQKMTEELAKVQAKALPGQLGGCLSVIIFLIMFIQVRNVILDLVKEGYHSYNNVAYSFMDKKNEDYIKLNMPEGFSYGEHELLIEVNTDNNVKLSKKFNFIVTDNVLAVQEDVRNKYLNMTEGQRIDERNKLNKDKEQERAQDFGVYNEDLKKSLIYIPISKFLTFTTDSVSKYVLTENNPSDTFYLRAPSGEGFDYSTLNVTLDGNSIMDKVSYNQGDKLNLDFFGINLSKVATDFGLTNIAVSFPYILLAVITAITQYFVSKLTAPKMSEEEKNRKAKEERKRQLAKEKGKEEEIDMMDFTSSMGQMNIIFPILTLLMSLGFLGGADFIPTGVTLFWTTQNLFVIIQQSISEFRQKNKTNLKNKK